jgi:hypothetical protein
MGSENLITDSINITSHELTDFYDSTDLHMGMSLDDFLYSSEFQVLPSN